MKVFAVFVLFIAVAAAFPSAESQAETKPELQPEQHQEQQNTFYAVEGNPKGDNVEENEAERAKRHIFFSKFFYPWPVAYTSVVASPVVYAHPVVTKTVTRTVAAPVVTQTYTHTVPTVVEKTYVAPAATSVVETNSVAVAPVVKTAGVRVRAPFVDVAVGR